MSPYRYSSKETYRQYSTVISILCEFGRRLTWPQPQATQLGGYSPALFWYLCIPYCQN